MSSSFDEIKQLFENITNAGAQGVSADETGRLRVWGTSVGLTSCRVGNEEDNHLERAPALQEACLRLLRRIQTLRGSEWTELSTAKNNHVI